MYQLVVEEICRESWPKTDGALIHELSLWHVWCADACVCMCGVDPVNLVVDRVPRLLGVTFPTYAIEPQQFKVQTFLDEDLAMTAYLPAFSARKQTSLKTATPAFILDLLPPAAEMLVAAPDPSVASALGCSVTCMSTTRAPAFLQDNRATEI
jgi:hypothetical protein